MENGKGDEVIEWHMMEPTRYFPALVSTSFAIRSLVFPLLLTKTRLQNQRGSSEYSGTADVIRRTLKQDGIRGLYRGFGIHSITISCTCIYAGLYENFRHLLVSFGFESNQVRGLISGALAQACIQTVLVPCDIVSQHMMAYRTKVLASGSDPSQTMTAVSSYLRQDDGRAVIYKREKTRFLAPSIIRAVYALDGLRGFYRGFFASACFYIPNSALFWSFYATYSDSANAALRNRDLQMTVPSLLVRSLAGCCAGLSATLLSNPLDVLRTRLQLRRESFGKTLRRVVAEDGVAGLLTKGLGARLTGSAISSTIIIFMYESIKRFSLKEEFRRI